LWLRWFTLEGKLISLPAEEAIAAQQEAAEAKTRAERLRQLGVNPDELD
jgi:outer membrane murein-binding lipoprotein Lpp